MAALTAARMTLTKKDVMAWDEFPVAGSTTIYAGGMVGLKDGYLVPGSADATIVMMGKALETVANTGSAGAKRCKVEFGAFHFGNSSTGDAIAQADVGNFCYVVDDQTVAKTSNSGARPRAGRIEAVDAGGVFVTMVPSAVPSDVVTLTGSETITSKRIRPAQGGALSFTSNDVVVAIASGSAFDIPTTAAASTVTLSATGAVKGDRMVFRANGTANGHTVQYRDATGPTNLTTALTASKRHLAIFEFDGTAWVGNAYVAP